MIYALTITTVAFTSLESASGLSSELAISRAGVRRIAWFANLTILVVYVGIAVVAVTAVPVLGGHSALATDHLGAPVIGIVERFHPSALADTLKYTVAAGGRCDADRRRALGDARPVAARLLAGDQPADSERAWGACIRSARRRSC